MPCSVIGGRDRRGRRLCESFFAPVTEADARRERDRPICSCLVAELLGVATLTMKYGIAAAFRMSQSTQAVLSSSANLDERSLRGEKSAQADNSALPGLPSEDLFCGFGVLCVLVAEGWCSG